MDIAHTTPGTWRTNGTLAFQACTVALMASAVDRMVMVAVNCLTMS